MALTWQTKGVRRALVVDDDEPIRRLLRVNLDRAGFAVDAAANGEAALALLDAGPPPDLLITDVMMPVMDGLEMLKRIRERPELADLPTIVMGALRNDVRPDDPPGFDALEDMRFHFRGWFGRCAYVVKPFNPQEVLRLAEAML